MKTVLYRSLRRRGMTLVEILAVVVILGLVAGIAVVSFSGTFNAAQHEIVKPMMAKIAQSVEAYYMKHGAYPTSAEGLNALTAASPESSYYLSQDLVNDPWNRAFQYMSPGTEGHPYEIMTFGRDGAPGGDGPDADLSSVHMRDED